MTKNMGALDRIIRLILAAAIAALYFANMISGLAAVILGIIAGVFVVTSVIGTCPAYIPFRLSTRKKSAH